MISCCCCFCYGSDYNLGLRWAIMRAPPLKCSHRQPQHTNVGDSAPIKKKKTFKKTMEMFTVSHLCETVFMCVGVKRTRRHDRNENGSEEPNSHFCLSWQKQHTHTRTLYTYAIMCTPPNRLPATPTTTLYLVTHGHDAHTEWTARIFWEWMMDVILNWKMRWLVLVIIDAVGGRVVGRKHEGHGEKNAECWIEVWISKWNSRRTDRKWLNRSGVTLNEVNRAHAHTHTHTDSYLLFAAQQQPDISAKEMNSARAGENDTRMSAI